MTQVLEKAVTGFSAADVYHRARPSYTDEVLEYMISNLQLNNASVVVDLAAGTGKMTELLVKKLKGPKIIAVEPVDDMRRVLAENLGSTGLEVINGTAGKIPLATGSVDVVIIAQAFHWFATVEALVEINRVLKPGAPLCLVWNMEDGERSEWVHNLRKIYCEFDGDVPQYRTGKWKEVFTEDSNSKNPLFGALDHKHYKWHIPEQTPKQVWERVLSKSFIQRLDAEKKEQIKSSVFKVLHEVNADFRKIPNLADVESSDKTTAYPYTTEVVITKKRS